MKFAIRRADTTNDAIYRKRYAHAMKSTLRQEMKADLISSEAVRRRFHPSLLGFHRATHDFIDFSFDLCHLGFDCCVLGALVFG